MLPNIEIFNLNLMDFINLFFLFSFCGYILECIVLSLENKKLVLDRGFGHGPFCIIYGFGAVGANILLRPIAGNIVLLYFGSAVLATVMELITANVMIKLFGEFWWDYSNKPYNYKGIVCLETSVGWGALGIVYFYFLDIFMRYVTLAIPRGIAPYTAVIVSLGYIIDFNICIYHRIINRGNDNGERIGRLRVF